MVARRAVRARRLPSVNLRRLESSHAAKAKVLLDPLRDIIERELFPILESFVSESSARSDDITDIISTTFDKIRVSFAARFTATLKERELEQSADQIAQAGADVHRRQLKTVLGVDPIQAEPWLETEVNAFVKENSSLITTLTDKQIGELEQLVYREGRRRSSVTEIKNKIVENFQTTEARARLIARDQVSKFNGKLTEIRQKRSGITRYRWVTSRDGRVRSLSNSSGYSDHRKLDGEVFNWDEPPVTVFKGKRAGERNHPGEDINCRCIAQPVLEDLIPGLET